MSVVLVFLLVLLGAGHAQAQVTSPMLAPPVTTLSGAVPNGGPPQLIGYSDANTPASVTIVGDLTLTLSGPSQYTATVNSIGGVTVGNIATLNVGEGLVISAGNMLNVQTPLPIKDGGTGTTTAPTAGQVLIAQSPTAYAPMPIGGDMTIGTNGQVTVIRLNGTTPGGVCSAGQFVSSINSSGIPTCTTPGLTGIPGGAVHQLIGYSAANVPESQTVGGGPGNCTYTRTGANAGQMVCPGYVSTGSPTFTGTLTLPDGSTWTSTGLTGKNGSFTGLTSTTLSTGNLTINSGTGGIRIAAGGIYYQPGYSPPGFPAYWDQNGIQLMQAIGIGQAIGADPIDITKNGNAPALILILNNSNGSGASAALTVSNGTNTGRFQMAGTGLASSGGLSPNTLIIWSDQGINYNTNNSLTHRFFVNGALQATIAGNGLHLNTALEISSGGLGTSTAPAQNQILIAQSPTSYVPRTLSGDISIDSTGRVKVGGISGTQEIVIPGPSQGAKQIVGLCDGLIIATNISIGDDSGDTAVFACGEGRVEDENAQRTIGPAESGCFPLYHHGAPSGGGTNGNVWVAARYEPQQGHQTISRMGDGYGIRWNFPGTAEQTYKVITLCAGP